MVHLLNHTNPCGRAARVQTCHAHTGDAFERLLAEFTQPDTADQRSPQMESEIDSFWMATNVMCPQNSRAALRDRALNDPEQLPIIAKEIGIPDSYVGYLFAPNYEEIISKIIAK